MGDLDAFIGGFVVESRENLSRFERDLVDLERNPSSRETLDSAFRAIHNLKGASSFLGLGKLEAVAHSGETLLSHLRGGDLTINPAITTGLLSLVDYTATALVAIESTGTDAPIDHTALVEALTRLSSGEPGPDAPGLVPAPPPPTVTAPSPEVDLESEPKEFGRATRVTGNIRVDIEQMDALMNLVGELVLARNEMLQSAIVQQHATLLSTSQRLNTITSQLQDGIMKTRMQPIDTVWSTFPRIVRDLALQEGKCIRLDMEGRETELDRSLIEAIKDPLTHLIRNAVDHGLESPQARTAKGKAAEGRLVLRAFHEGGQVNIEVSDDGGGINVAAVKAKAVDRGLITPDQARAMGDREATNLIFLPGFSTAEKITNISGRGVGMDVVKTNIERIGGKVAIQSEPGLGTSLKIRIPLTLAILPALIVRSGRDRYAIPQVNVLELVRLDRKSNPNAIERIQDAAVCRLRGELLPLVSLNAELASVQGAGSNASTWSQLQAETTNIVVLLAEDRKFGLIVDDVDDTQEIVVKPLGKHLRGIATFAGATIMGDGKVALILDPLGLAVHAQVLSGTRDSDEVSAEAPESSEAFLLFEGPDQARMAIPLSQAMRLEEFKRSAIERRGQDDVVQYRGGILPLRSIAALLPEWRHRSSARLSDGDANETVHAIVYSNNGHQVGVVVEKIIDTLEESVVAIAHEPHERGRRSTVIHGRVTEMLDLDRLCANASVSPIRNWTAA